MFKNIVSTIDICKVTIIVFFFLLKIEILHIQNFIERSLKSSLKIYSIDIKKGQ